MRCLIFLFCFVCLASSLTAFLSPTPTHHYKSRGSTGRLHAKKAPTKKIQVKLKKDIQGTGQKGDIIQVTPAFFQNKLRPNAAAELISDEEKEKEARALELKDNDSREEAKALADELAETTISIQRKAGPEGNLFGGIGPKVIMEQCKATFKDHIEFLSRKGVKIVALTDENGKKMRQDIKHTGEFGAQIVLTKEISGNIKIEVKAE